MLPRCAAWGREASAYLCSLISAYLYSLISVYLCSLISAYLCSLINSYLCSMISACLCLLISAYLCYVSVKTDIMCDRYIDRQTDLLHMTHLLPKGFVGSIFSRVVRRSVVEVVLCLASCG